MFTIDGTTIPAATADPSSSTGGSEKTAIRSVYTYISRLSSKKNLLSYSLYPSTLAAPFPFAGYEAPEEEEGVTGKKPLQLRTKSSSLVAKEYTGPRRMSEIYEKRGPPFSVFRGGGGRIIPENYLRKLCPSARPPSDI